MARQTYYITRDMKNPLRYPTRMLTAGQEVSLSPSAADLFRKVGVELTDQAPKRAAPKVREPVTTDTTTVTLDSADTVNQAPKPAAKKAPAKKATRRKKS